MGEAAALTADDLDWLHAEVRVRRALVEVGGMVAR